MNKVLVFLAAGLGITCIFLGYLVFVMITFPEWGTRGQFGDAFGTLNSLFSGLAFAGLIFTIYVQRSELAIQSETLSLTREEIARTAAAQEKSELAIKAQSETAQKASIILTVNSLIKYYDDELNKIKGPSYEDGDPRLRQIEIFEKKKSELNNYLENFYSDLNNQISFFFNQNNC